MNILIAGIGKVGATLARQLVSEGHDLTLIDIDQEALEQCAGELDAQTLCGNGATMEVLGRAGVEKADLLIATAGADEVNLLMCSTARFLQPRLHTIARIRNPEYSGQVYRMRDAFGLSLAINPERQAAVEMERLLKYPGFLKRDTFAKGRIEIVELKVERHSKLRDVSLSNLYATLKCKVLVCVVLREGCAIIPDGAFVLQEEDRVFVTATPQALTVMLKNLGMIPHAVKRVMLAGGGRVSYYLAEMLERDGMQVQLVEQNAERCRELASLLPKTTVLCGDASNPALLASEGLDRCDAFVSLTGLDELNIVLSLSATAGGVPQVITKLGRIDSFDVLNRLPLGSMISPKDLCCSSIVRYVRAVQNQSGAALAVHAIAEDRAEAMEFRVDESTRCCGVPLKQLKMRPGVLVAGISDGERMEIPTGDSVFHVGDTLLLVRCAGRTVYQLNDIFE